MKRLNNESGKVATVVIIIVMILLTSFTAISVFYWNKEKERREMVEEQLDSVNDKLIQSKDQIEELKKTNVVLDSRNKEADEKINSLSEEIDLEKGLKEQLKQEMTTLKKQVGDLALQRDEMQKKMAADASRYEQQLVDLEIQLKKEINLRQKMQTMGAGAAAAEGVGGNQETSAAPSNMTPIVVKDPQEAAATIPQEPAQDIKLDKIVVAPNEIPQGRVLSVDTQTEFLIMNLGQKDGIQVGMIMSVFRGKDYLGDVKVTRLLPEMAAADFVEPFSSRSVRKNDQVVVKQ